MYSAKKTESISTAIEEWAKTWKSYPTEPLSEENTKFMIKLALNLDSVTEDNKELMAILNGRNSLESMFWLRISNMPVKCSVAAAVLISSVIDSPGVSSMFAAYLQYVGAKILHTKLISFNDVCTIVIPYGPPTKESLNKLWDAQKCHIEGFSGDNLVDCLAAYKSLENPYQV